MNDKNKDSLIKLLFAVLVAITFCLTAFTIMFLVSGNFKLFSFNRFVVINECNYEDVEGQVEEENYVYTLEEFYERTSS